MKLWPALLGIFALSSTVSAQDLVHTTDGVFFCHGNHPRCSWTDQTTYPYFQFGGQHVGQMSGVSDLLPNGPPLPQYQSWLTELISDRPNTNAVASWSDATSRVDGGRVWGGFISARTGFSQPGWDSQLIGLEIDVLNGGLPGVSPNLGKVGLQIVGFGNPNTDALQILTETPSAAFQNILSIQPNSIAPTGAVIGMAPQHIARGIDFQGSTFSDGAFLLSPNQKIRIQNSWIERRLHLSRSVLQWISGAAGGHAGPPRHECAGHGQPPNRHEQWRPDHSARYVLKPDHAREQPGEQIRPSWANGTFGQLGIGPSSRSCTGRHFRERARPGTAAAAATGAGSMTGGAQAVASGDGAVALGSNSTASADEATAVGTGAQAVAANSIAVGSSAQVTGAASTAIGEGAQSSGSNSVALGANSTDAAESNVVSLGSATELADLPTSRPV